MIFEYKGRIYPDYIRKGNAAQFVLPYALQLCQGKGLDVGAGRWPLPGATPVELADGGDAMSLPEGIYNYIFSSHCLEHLANPVAAIEHWKTRLAPGGVLFLYLPHPDMEYWLPQNNRKHLHAWQPKDVARLLSDLGFENVIHSERDLAWGFSVVGFVPG
jgi:SAM-dependent methyltransferase